MIDHKQEKEFIRKVFLPAFISILEETGMKPLIVPLEPTEIEGGKFWICYPKEMMSIVKDKLPQQ